MKKNTSKNEFIEQNPHLKDFMPMLDQLNKESHRGATLLACSYIEDQLAEIISSFLIESKECGQLLEGFNAPLGTLSARATMAYCLGLISEKEYEEVKLLKKIRNAFAHNFRANFDDQKIIELCKNLHYSAKDYGEVVVGSFGKFNTSAVGLILNLTNRAHYVGQKRLKTQSWPY